MDALPSHPGPKALQGPTNEVSTDEAELEQAILALVRRPGYQPVKPRVLAQRLHLGKDRAGEVKRAVKRLVRQGQLAYGASHRVALASAASPKGNQVVGVFRRAEGGYGFVRPSGAAVDGTSAADIFIPVRHAGDAASGDLVVVRLRKQVGRKRPRAGAAAPRGPRGEIVEVLQRETHQFVGRLFESGGSAYVEVDGNLFARPIYVGDPGSKQARPDDKVVFEMIRFPSHLHEGEGVVTEVLGPRGAPGVDTLSILREFGLPERFPDDALADARRQVDRFDESIPADRLDLTGQTVITIDPIDARDFDDAISLERSEEGGWNLGVHIADVAHFVPPKSALDREAFQRATSVYLPDRVLPMLPESISNGLASLQPGKVRYTLSVRMEFTADGLRVASEVRRSAIKSRRRLTYEEVDDYLRQPDAWRRKLGLAVHALLGRMHELAMILRRRRLQRGALELTMPEVKIDLDKHGRVAGAYVVRQTESHQIIEEFMLAANETVAETLRDQGLRFLRRIHQAPAPRKLEALAEFVAALGIKTDGLQSRFELQGLLARVAGRPEQHAVNYAVLRSLQRAVYGPQEEGHYALASDCYCHFTSPIRRYPDLTVHRLLHAVLDGAKPPSNLAELAVLGEHCSQREQRAEMAERELTRLKLLAYLDTRIGEEMDAVITGVESYGLFAQGIQLPAEGLIHVDSLCDDYYRFDRASHTLSGLRAGNRYRLGDLVRVAVGRVDVDRRELDFRLVEHLGRSPPGRKAALRRRQEPTHPKPQGRDAKPKSRTTR